MGNIFIFHKNSLYLILMEHSYGGGISTDITAKEEKHSRVKTSIKSVQQQILMAF
jgi:hypothetical protein